ncbi:hypothetical protein [Chondrinema litorale]|uniref:hypothetical protein n=1 Tax=Chondrinema litorale TaxID=2994555 RepID=UPI002542CDD5|nr:hypothetical protein [Chondrinema litorale]UZR94085.1 hypothetical protein OQ292_19775 [Chondrinema litorale]
MKRLHFALFIFLILLASCDPDRKKLVDPEKHDYNTLESTELFFKNMRQPYYDLEEKKEAGLELFRLQDRIEDDSHALLNLCIIFNWRNDDAFIYLEPNNFFKDTTSFTIIWKNEQNKQGSFQFIQGNRDSHFEFAARVYNSILQEYQLFYEKNDVLFPVLDSDVERDVFRVTMFDYFRLINYY